MVLPVCTKSCAPLCCAGAYCVAPILSPERAFVVLLPGVALECAQEQLDSMRRHVNLLKARPLSRWSNNDLAAWVEVGVGLPQVARSLALAPPAPPGQPSLAEQLGALDQRTLAAKVQHPPRGRRGVPTVLFVCRVYLFV